MKKLLLSAVALVLLSPIAHARDSLDGCGLGWEVTDKKTYTATTTRGTTNSVVPRAFGMTTGTLGCEKLEIGSNDKEAADYVATNFEVLKTELAAGRGEYVDALAGAFGCSANSAEVGQTLQQNYSKVVAPAQNAAQLYKGIKGQLAGVCI
ncbi:MAG: DUF3015 family protein [Bdellovibrionales bacterium]